MWKIRECKIKLKEIESHRKERRKKHNQKGGKPNSTHLWDGTSYQKTHQNLPSMRIMAWRPMRYLKCRTWSLSPFSTSFSLKNCSNLWSKKPINTRSMRWGGCVLPGKNTRAWTSGLTLMWRKCESLWAYFSWWECIICRQWKITGLMTPFTERMFSELSCPGTDFKTFSATGISVIMKSIKKADWKRSCPWSTTLTRKCEAFISQVRHYCSQGVRIQFFRSDVFCSPSYGGSRTFHRIENIAKKFFQKSGPIEFFGSLRHPQNQKMGFLCPKQEK